MRSRIGSTSDQASLGKWFALKIRRHCVFTLAGRKVFARVRHVTGFGSVSRPRRNVFGRSTERLSERASGCTFARRGGARSACPECDVSLTAFRVGKVEVDRCSRCHGLWLDAGELREILNLYPATVRSGRASRITDQALSGMDIATTEPIFQLLEGTGELTAEAAQKAAEVIVEIVSGLFSAW